MLAKLELKLKCEKELTYQMSSLFHGALMELLPEKYADYLHISSLHPYAQHLECREGNWYWVITGLNKEAVKSVYSDGEDIVSSCQGVVKKIITRSGTPLVACGDEVQEGQVLVSGRVAVTDDSGTELYQVDVCPDADILVHTVIAYDDILEREYGYRQYTKRRYSSLIIENNSGLIKLTKPHRRIEQYDIITQKYPLIVAGGIDTGIVIGVENRKEYKVMNDRYNDVQLEDILNERLQMYISHMEQKGVQIMDCRVNIDTTDDRGSCTGELEVLLPVTN